MIRWLLVFASLSTLCAHADFRDPNGDLRDLAMQAIKRHDLDELKSLVAQGLDPSKLGDGALNDAVNGGDADITTYLLEQGLKPTPYLGYSIAQGNSVPVLQALLKYGYELAVPNTWQDKYMTPEKQFYPTCVPLLYDVTKAGDIELVKFLIAQGVNVNARCSDYYLADSDGFLTPLHALALADNYDHNETLAENREKVVQLLLDAGANPNSRSNNDGTTAIPALVNTYSYSTVAKLLQHGAQLTGGNDLLAGAYDRKVFADPNKMLAILKYGKINFRETDKNGANLLFYTVVNDMQFPSRNFEVWETLIKGGTPTDEVTPGISAMDLARRAAFTQAALNRLQQLGVN